MERGTSDERTLAYVGIVLWGVWGVLSLLPPSSMIAVGVSVAGVFLGLKEIKAWKAGELLTRPARKAGTPVYPRWAWFAVGAVPGSFLVSVAVAVTASTSRPENLFLPSTIGWIAGGLGVQSLLVARANRRGDAMVSAIPPPPRPDAA